MGSSQIQSFCSNEEMFKHFVNMSPFEFYNNYLERPLKYLDYWGLANCGMAFLFL